jgi:carboxymethylenebutenolidase
VAVDATETVPAELSVPDSMPAPGVVVIHEILGLNDDMRRIVARFASHGYVALAPDFLAGLGPRPVCMVRLLRGIAEGREGAPFRRLHAARQWLGGRAEISPGPVGIAGFCLGGGFALLYAASASADGDAPQLGAVAPFYGSVPKDESTLARVCPTVASYGARDGSLVGAGERLTAALERYGVAHDVKTYPEAGHSFANRLHGVAGAIGRLTPMHAGYVESAAEDAWARTIAFFDRHLRAAGETPP